MRSFPSCSSIGRVLLGTSLAAFGVEDILRGDFLPELQPVPAGIPGRAVLAYLTGAILIIAGACLVANHRVRGAARVLVAVLALCVIGCYLPALIATPRNGGAWTGAFEVIALAGGAAVLAFPATPALGRIAFAAALPVFGLLHFVYIDYVAYVIPAWIPAHVFFGYATGVAHIAAGASLLSGVQARLAAICTAAMFGSWVVLLHAPRAAAASGNRAEWSSLFVALAMCGGSLLLVAPRRRASASQAHVLAARTGR